MFQVAEGKTALTPYYGIQIRISHMCFSLMLVSMDGQESSHNPMMESMSWIS